MGRGVAQSLRRNSKPDRPRQRDVRGIAIGQAVAVIEARAAEDTGHAHVKLGSSRVLRLAWLKYNTA